MLKRKFRMARGDLNAFFKSKTKQIRGNFLSARILLNKFQYSRFAFVVSGPKKSAAKRNLLKRRLSELVRNHKNKPKNMDVVFFLRIADDVINFERLKQDVDYVFSQIGL